jgi:hypothetical protein
MNCIRGSGEIAEIPNGPVDGTNTIFQTRSLPDPRYPLEVFRNGLPLVKGSDFQNSGNVLVFSAGQTPQRDDRLQVEYVPQRGSTSSTNGHPNPSAPTQLDSLCQIAAVQALRSEAATLSARLNRQYQEKPNQPLSSSDRRAENFNMEGVDGLGDGLFSLDTGSHPVTGRGSEAVTTAPEVPAGSESVALRMLAKRLERAPNPQNVGLRPAQSDERHQLAATSAGEQ